MNVSHFLPFGAELVDAGAATRFRLWAPNAPQVLLRLAGESPVDLPMQPEAGGWHQLTTDQARVGSRYQYVVGDLAVPDPVSRFQPDDVHGASEVVDPASHAWRDLGWKGRPWEEVVIYELHTGTFSAGGDFAGVIDHLDHLVALGITAVELLPVADFPGARNWGYDGVLLYAPDSRYGRPEDAEGPGRGLPCARAVHLSRRRLQPFRARRQLPAGLRAHLLHRPPQDALGRGDRFRRRRQPCGARLLCPQRDLLARGIPVRRPALRRGARDPGRKPDRHRHRDRRGGACAFRRQRPAHPPDPRERQEPVALPGA